MSVVDRIKHAWDREPVVIINAVVGLIEAVIVMLAVLGIVDLSGEQQAAVIAVVIAAGTTIQTIMGRSRVEPKRKLS